MRSLKGLTLLAVAALLLSGCGPSEQDLLATEQADATRVFATAAAIMTEAADEFTATPTPTLTGTPTSTPTITLTAGTAATNTSQPQVTPCNLAGFVDDVTIPDGTEFAPGETFTKTWRLRNDGTCTWDSSYNLIFVSGDQMDGPASQQLTSGTTAPGETIDISVELSAPTDAETYIGYWGLQSGSGEYFGLDSAGSSFYVQIEVSGEAEEATATTEPTDEATAEPTEETVEPTDEPTAETEPTADSE